MFRTSKLQKIVKVPQVQDIDEVAKVPWRIRSQVPMIQDETQKDQKPEEVQVSFSPYLKSRTDKAEVQKSADKEPRFTKNNRERQRRR